jgi:Glycosyl transferase family 90
LTEFAGWLDELGSKLPGGLGADLSQDAEAQTRYFEHREAITAEELEGVVEGRPDLTRYQVVDRTVYRVHRDRQRGKEWVKKWEEKFERMLRRLLALVPTEILVPDFDFVVNLGDYPVRGAPIFSRWVKPGDHNIQFPSDLMWELDPTVSLHDSDVRSDRLFDSAALTRPWNDRASMLFWRGTATGMYESRFRLIRLRALARLPIGRGVTRLDLCRIAASNPDVIDAAVVGWQQLSDGVAAILRTRYRHGPPVPRSRFLEHRFVINVDGNVATSSFLTFLGSGSAIVRQATPYSDWCSHRLHSGEHFVPIARDLSDLVTTAHQCLADPGNGGRISENGRAFAERYLTGQSIDFYILSVFSCYARISPTIAALHPQAVRAG